MYACLIEGVPVAYLRELAFRLLHVVRRQIIEKKGGNNFMIKHTGIRKQMKAEGFNISE